MQVYLVLNHHEHIFELIRKHFDIVGIQGFMGLSKWVFPLAMISEGAALKYGKSMYDKDLVAANKTGSGLWRCMHVTMHRKVRQH